MDTLLRWTSSEPREPGGDPRTALLEAAVEVCCPAGAPPGSIEVDSADFFFGGRKGGLGSSAAAAVGLCWALLALAAGAPPRPAAVLEAALAAHRRAQGGRGSGYDVFASFHGGAGLFAGGARPSWQPLDLPWLEPLYLFHGERSLSTPGAIGKYREWRLRRPEEAGSFLEQSNRLVRSFSRAASRLEALGSLRRCRELGLRLGEAIGVPAAMQPPDDWDGIRAEDCKALGAGNELGLAFPELPPESRRTACPEACGRPGWPARGWRRRARSEPSDPPAGDRPRQAAAVRGARRRARPPGRGAVPFRDDRGRARSIGAPRVAASRTARRAGGAPGPDARTGCASWPAGPSRGAGRRASPPPSRRVWDSVPPRPCARPRPRRWGRAGSRPRSSGPGPTRPSGCSTAPLPASTRAWRCWTACTCSSPHPRACPRPAACRGCPWTWWSGPCPGKGIRARWCGPCASGWPAGTSAPPRPCGSWGGWPAGPRSCWKDPVRRSGAWRRWESWPARPRPSWPAQGLSTAELDGLLREGLSCGAWGGKLSGAGGGGAFFLICPGADSAGRIAARLRATARRAGLPTAGTIRSLSWPE